MNPELIKIRDNAHFKKCDKCGEIIFYVSTGEEIKCPNCGHVIESGDQT